MSAENRKLHRRKAFKTVRFIQTTGGDGIECRMSDMHSQGAKLTFKGLSPNCGNSIEIMILPELVPVPAFKVWTELNEMGIRFKNPVGYLRKHDHMVEA